jgi:hypothetical protein
MKKKIRISQQPLMAVTDLFKLYSKFNKVNE